MKTDKAEIVVAFRATEELVKKINSMAKEENRTRANMVLCLIERAIESVEKSVQK